MRITYIIFLLAGLQSISFCQDRILYDLDSYRRVDVDLRITRFSPDMFVYYDKQLNNPGSSKFYSIRIGMDYRDSHQINNANSQKTINRVLDLDLRSGTQKSALINLSYETLNRSYNGMKYFKNGWNVSSNIAYYDSQNPSSSRYEQDLNLEYDIGFGFGRLEIINNAWIGARILEELNNNSLLVEVPNLDEMKLFFDLIGDLEYERVLDFRLRSIYRVENIIKYIEDNGWIEKGSVPAFVIIYDAYRYEDFIFRESGERLEFTLSPELSGRYRWRNFGNPISDNFIQPGFIGKIEYEIHRNGDLEFYTTKSFGGIIEHNERIFKDRDESVKTYSGDMFFNHIFQYIPSLRTNFSLNTSFMGGFVYSDSYTARITARSSFSYKYYFSPATQMVLGASITYDDERFQLGAYQPRIIGSISFDIVHAIR